MKTDNNLILRNLAGTALQHRLSASADGKQTAFTGTLRLKIILFKLPGHLPDQMILQCNTGAVLLIESFGKFRLPMGNLHMKAGRCCKRVSLHMINHQHVSVKLPCPRQRFIRRITLVIHRMQ